MGKIFKWLSWMLCVQWVISHLFLFLLSKISISILEKKKSLISLSTLETRDQNFKFLFLLSKFKIRISNISFYSRIYFFDSRQCLQHALFTKRSSCISWPPYDLHLIYFWSHFPRKKHKIEKSPYSRRAIPAAVWNVAKYVFWDNSRCLQTDLHLHLTPAKLLTNV